MTKRMDGDALSELFRTMSWIWGVVAANYSVACVTSAASLPVSGRDGRFYFWLRRVSSTQSSLAFVGILLVGHVAVRYNCQKAALAEHEKYSKKMSTRETSSSKSTWTAGYMACINQAHCAGICFVYASLALAKWIVSFNTSTLISHIFSVYNFLTPFTISLLLFKLNKVLLRAAISEIQGDSNNVVNRDEDVYRDLFLAATSFYNEVASTLKTA